MNSYLIITKQIHNFQCNLIFEKFLQGDPSKTVEQALRLGSVFNSIYYVVKNYLHMSNIQQVITTKNKNI